MKKARKPRDSGRDIDRRRAKQDKRQSALRAHLPSNQRRAERVGQWGRMLEERVAGILQKMAEAGDIDSFVRHNANSPEDCEGKDFTVRKEGENRSFGISISVRSSREGALRYPDVPQWHIPINTNDETIQGKVIGLFQAKK